MFICVEFIQKIFCILSVILVQYFKGMHAKETTPSCGLVSLPPGVSTPENPITTPELSDLVEENFQFWKSDVFGSVVKISLEPNNHLSYLKGRFCTEQQTYQLLTTDKTKYFTREMGIRFIERNVNFECTDGSVSKYHFKVPLVDVTPPGFLNYQFSFNITTNWEIGRPISEGYECIVFDNAVELETTKQEISYSKFSTPEYGYSLPIIAERLWMRSSIENKYMYKLHFYLNENIELWSGRHITKWMYAVDPNGLKSVDPMYIDIYVK